MQWFLRLPHFSKSPSHLLFSPPPPPAASSTHRCIEVSCCGCSRCRLAGRLWSSTLWRRAGSRCCRSRSPVCRRSNQQRAHLRSLAHWAHRMTQLQAARGRLLTHMLKRSTRHTLERSAERRLVNTDMVNGHIQSHFCEPVLNTLVCVLPPVFKVQPPLWSTRNVMCYFFNLCKQLFVFFIFLSNGFN